MNFPLFTEGLDKRDADIPIFFRDDDAGWDNGALLALCDVFVDRAPLDLAVIPVEVDSGLADSLLSHSADLRFHQHGYAHVNHRVEGRKCEFSDDRPIDEIRIDVVRGQEILDELFGSSVDPIFTPPWNRCGIHLAECLPKVGIRMLSRDASATPFDLPRLIELPVTLDWTRHTGNVDLALAERVRDDHIGIMLHHATLGPEDLSLLANLLDLLIGHPRVRLGSMLDIAKAALVS